MFGDDGTTATSLLSAGVRFVAHWLLLSISLLPLALVLAVLETDGLGLVGGANLGLAAIAVDRDVGLDRMLAFALTAILAFAVLAGSWAPVRSTDSGSSPTPASTADAESGFATATRSR